MRVIHCGRVVDAPETPHRVGPSYEDVFAEPLGEAKNYVVPLASMTLADFPFPLHLVYCELSHSTSELRFKVDRDGRYRIVGGWEQVVSDLKLDGFPEVEYPERWLGKYVEFLDIDVPDLEDGAPWGLSPEELAQIDKRHTYWGIAGEAARWRAAINHHVEKRDKSLDPKCSFGGVPDWLQTPRPPVSSEREPMQFVGQFRAPLFTDHSADFHLMLYVDRHLREVVQIAQNS